MFSYAGHKLTKQEILQTFGLNEIGMVKAVVKDNWRLALQDFYFYYVGDALSDVKACREVSVTCLSAVWSDSAELKELKKINPTYIFNNISSLKSFLESKLSDVCYL